MNINVNITEKEIVKAYQTLLKVEDVYGDYMRDLVNLVENKSEYSDIERLMYFYSIAKENKENIHKGKRILNILYEELTGEEIS